MLTPPPLAIVTGASSGIGYHLARQCAEHGYDLIVVADHPTIEEAADLLREFDGEVTPVQADLATAAGVSATVAAADERPIDVLIANAGHGLGGAFLDQDFDAARHVLDTNVTGTLALIHRVGLQMRARCQGRILITGSIAGYEPGTMQAVYNATKAFIDSFAVALSHELKDSGVSVTCLMPGVTDTHFFERAGLQDTRMGRSRHKADPAEVARDGFEAMQRGQSHIVSGLGNKLRVAMTSLLTTDQLAEMHRRQASRPQGPRGFA